MAFNADNLKDEILIELGDSKMPVEIGRDELDVCIKRALEKYSMYKPLAYSESYKALTRRSNAYDINAVPYSAFDVHSLPEDVIGVKSVSLIPAINGSILSGLQVENALINGVPVYLGAGELTLDIDYLNIRRQWLKTVSRQLASDPAYEVIQDPDTGIFSIYVFCTSPIFVDVRATRAYNKELTNIPHYNQYWFHRWTLSEAMLMLGRIRSKYSHIPVAGGNMRLNGNELIDSATRMQQELLIELQATRADLFPHWA